MEGSMNSMLHLVPLVAPFVLLVHITPSWGGPPNPTMSDMNGNTAGGSLALQNVVRTPTGGNNNTAFGLDTLENTTTGDNNAAVGALTLLANITGSFNTAIGGQALSNNTTGDGNTASGNSALISNNTGSNNTAIGFRALRESTGTKNIALGYQARGNLTSGNNSMCLGNAGVSIESQTIRVGTGQTRTFIAGIAGTGVGNAAVMIDTATGQLGVVTSSARHKRDIVPMGNRSAKVLALQPVTFAYRDDAQGEMHYGLIAEEVAAVLPELVTRTSSGEVHTVKYHELIPILLNELQRQPSDLARLEALVEQGRGGEASTCTAAERAALAR
jgi:hypothetical protein